MACLFPFSVKNPRYGLPDQPANLPVPCGTCPECVRRRVNEWSFRLQQEERNFALCYFITLTYELPPMSKNGFMTLQKKDVQDYWQRIRMSFAKRENVNGRWRWNYEDVPKFKYYVCGEYGSKTQRPHYHAIVFGLSEDVLTENWQGIASACRITGEMNAVLLGSIYIGSVTGASIGYTLKYMAKGKTIPVHARDDRVPEFAMMSKKLGANYLVKETVQHHRDLSKLHLTNPDGYSIAMPRYYKEKIWSDEERRKLGKAQAQRQTELEAKRLAAYIKRTGSPVGYDKAKFEAKKAAVKHSREQAKNNRKTI